MKKRDLKADLEQIRNFRSMWRQSTSPEEDWKIGVLLEDFCRDKAELWLEQALAEKERADKLESLVRDVERVLERMKFLSEEGLMIDEIDDYQLDVAIAKAKEVLGDDSQGDNRAT